MDSAFQYIIANGGLTTEANYPYTAQDGTCSASKARQAAVKISSFVDVATNSEAALEAAIAQQPVSVAVEADQNSFQLYSGGVMTAACGANLDHGVLAVGYGTDSASGNEFWKVKNSWGADWGMAGYILLGKGKTYNGGAGQCGILSDPSYPVV
jgi:C1A family cysteine protease